MEKISRTQKKKAAQLRQKIGEQLVHISDAQFDALELPEELMEAVAMGRKMKSHEARRRQLQYIGRVMREMDPGIVESALETVTAGQAEDKRWFKQVERWRDELVAGNFDRLDWLVDKYPTLDREELGRLVGAARGNRTGVKPKAAGRLLFRYLRRAVG